MNTIILIINSKQYSYHLSLSTLIKEKLVKDGYSVELYDLSDYQQNISLLTPRLFKAEADYLITLDLAGFELRTQTGESALNLLYSRNLNLLWGNRDKYQEYLSGKISLSMCFFDASGTDNHLPMLYPNMLYYFSGTKYSLPIVEDYFAESAILQDVSDRIAAIWSVFLSFCQN